MRRNADFITFPGTGMWMISDGGFSFRLFRYLSKEDIKRLVNSSGNRLYWIDQGIGASTLYGVMQGGRSASATLITPNILARYLKE